uniref:Uncharacterized protein n=1 Tax=Strongyloides venezuelensis TaxID=75913 RepID=A0A0K0FZN4_STRVS
MIFQNWGTGTGCFSVVFQLLHRKNSELKISIGTKEDSEGCPFSVYSTFASIPDCESRKSNNQKHAEFESGEQIFRFLKMFNMRNIDYLSMKVNDNIDIFGIINKSFQKATKNGDLNIANLPETDITSFKKFH